ncbi:probable phosphoglycerate mutase [Enterococcus malodoratus]|uniref:histidine phosphatase family protein n=1 Tax=Enterococcus malodoratus TaxID=71451 RepID=UPI0008C1431F|nr:histidine phosphatase family protein [Enterococcus malodoratus]SES74341.1 probable phosphoglycerate mutase [Enterococcus malodoratus]
MTQFYFVRHGKTEINAKGRFNGGTVDSPLIESGVEATKRMAQHLKDVPFDRVLTSPQMRAQTTAKIILAENIKAPELTIVEELREMRLGDWDGKKIDQITAAYPEEIKNYRTRPDLFDAEKIHAESYNSLITRSTKVIEEVTAAHPNEKVLVVSHGILLMALLNTLKGIPLAKIRESGIVDNSSLTILNHSKEQTVFKTWGQTF